MDRREGRIRREGGSEEGRDRRGEVIRGRDRKEGQRDQREGGIGGGRDLER